MTNKINQTQVIATNNLKVLKDTGNIRICNYSDNYYGDQVCYVINLSVDRKSKT